MPKVEVDYRDCFGATVDALRGNGMLRVVGDGSLRRDLPEVARRLGVEGLVSFSGAVSGAEMPAVYRAADLFVLPSLVEGMPNVVLEAMASGLPVLATRIPGSEELVLHGKTGFLVPPSDPRALTDSLAALLEGDRLRAEMGLCARSQAEARSWRRVAESYLILFHQILRRT